MPDANWLLRMIRMNDKQSIDTNTKMMQKKKYSQAAFIGSHASHAVLALRPILKCSQAAAPQSRFLSTNKHSVVCTLESNPTTKPQNPKNQQHNNLKTLATSILLASTLAFTSMPNSPALAASGDPVQDQADVLPINVEKRLSDRLQNLEQDTGTKLRVLATRQPPSKEELSSLWPDLNANSVVVLVNPSSGNVIDFRVGSGLASKVKNTFLLELQGRFGNKFYVEEKGEDGAVQAVLENMEECIRDKDKVCTVVSGFSDEQYALSAVMSAAGGFIAGSALRTGNSIKPNWFWFGAFSPLWFILFVSFGILPIVQREGWINLHTGANVSIYLACVSAAWSFVPNVLRTLDKKEQ